jgi:hypothetical protein
MIYADRIAYAGRSNLELEFEITITLLLPLARLNKHALYLGDTTHSK